MNCCSTSCRTKWPEPETKGSADAVRIDQVTVLFTDFKGFTAISEQVTRSNWSTTCTECFSAFDASVTGTASRKIKTIGDAYGRRRHSGTQQPHAMDVVKAARSRDFIAEGKRHKASAVLRDAIGVHTGPVVAGIVGVKNSSTTSGGDTVNGQPYGITSGEVGQVKTSARPAYALVKSGIGLTFTPWKGASERARGGGDVFRGEVPLTGRPTGGARMARHLLVRLPDTRSDRPALSGRLVRVAIDKSHGQTIPVPLSDRASGRSHTFAQSSRSSASASRRYPAARPGRWIGAEHAAHGWVQGILPAHRTTTGHGWSAGSAVRREERSRTEWRTGNIRLQLCGSPLFAVFPLGPIDRPSTRGLRFGCCPRMWRAGPTGERPGYN